jgi:hypothetical protein
MDVQHGQGIETWPDSSTYKGGFHRGRKHGKGRLERFTKSVFYGDFDNNCIHGTGVHIWEDGRKYEGSWHRNKMHG